MKPAFRTRAIVLAATLAFARGGSVSAQEAFTPYYDDTTRSAPTPPKAKKIKHAKPMTPSPQSIASGPHTARKKPEGTAQTSAQSTHP